MKNGKNTSLKRAQLVWFDFRKGRKVKENNNVHGNSMVHPFRFVLADRSFSTHPLSVYLASDAAISSDRYNS